MDRQEEQATTSDLWDEEHVKALLRFPRYPTRLIQQEPWRSWIDQHHGMRAIYAYLQSYPLSPSQSKLLEVVLSHPETLADACAERLHISRATYFYRLRDLLPTLAHALNQWQIEAPETAAPRPPVAPGRPQPSTLPNPLTPLVGVEGTLEALAGLVQRPEVQLITVAGPWGIGKTRLALEAARLLAPHFHDGVRFVDLAPLADERAVAPSLARALGLAEGADQAPQRCKEHLRAKTMLLVLDTFEHVLPAGGLVSELLALAPRLKILITSRAVLHLYGEHVFTVPELALPRLQEPLTPERVRQAAAAELFVQRAQAVSPDFLLDDANATAVARLCSTLEGVPLALELAAAQIKVLSPKAMLARAARRLEFLAHGPCDVAARQQSLRDSLRWSYGMLAPEHALLFAQLGVFVDGFRIEAAEALCATGETEPEVVPGLMALVDQSLLQRRVDPDGEPRFLMREAVREFALEQLAAGANVPALRQAHARYYLALAEQRALLAPDDGNLEAARRWERERQISGEGVQGRSPAGGVGVAPT